MVEKDRKDTPETLIKIRNGLTEEELDYDKYNKLTSIEYKKLQELNAKLVGYEKEIKKQVKDLLDFASKKINDSKDWINNLDEVEVELFFYLSEEDENYGTSDTDNILISMFQGFHFDLDIYGIDDGQNHNDKSIKHPLGKDYHCWIFHSLYDHTQLQLKELARIGDIDVNMILRINNHSD